MRVSPTRTSLLISGSENLTSRTRWRYRAESGAILAAVLELPVLPRDPSCPAATPIAGATRGQRGVICREMQADQENDAGVEMTAGALGKLRETEGGVYLNVKGDPSTVAMLCHGSAVPVVTNDDKQGRASYTYCPVWQTARDRALAGEDGLTDPLEPETVAMGIAPDGEEVPVHLGKATHEAVDPIAAGLKGLDELAPVQG